MQKTVEKYRAHVKKVETHIPENEVHTQVNNIFMLIEIVYFGLTMWQPSKFLHFSEHYYM